MKVSFGAVTALAITILGGSAALSSANAAQIFVQQSGSAPAGGDPNIITNPGAFVVGPAGNQTYISPSFIIVAQYNSVGAPTVSYSGCATPSACPAATLGTYGLTGNNNVSFTAASGGTAFSRLGLNAGGSENFGNFSTADVALGLAAPTSFSLYAFQLPAALTAFNTLTIDTTATKGSFILGYACQNNPGLNNQCSNANLGETVFTNTGLVGVNQPPVNSPEPASIALLGAGLAALGFARRKSRVS